MRKMYILLREAESVYRKATYIVNWLNPDTAEVEHICCHMTFMIGWSTKKLQTKMADLKSYSSGMSQTSQACANKTIAHKKKKKSEMFS